MTQRDADVNRESQLARLTLRYLLRHPEAKDTADGIAMWWIRQQQIEHAVADVHRALALLLARQFIVERSAPDQQRYYELNHARIPDITQFLNEATK